MENKEKIKPPKKPKKTYVSDYAPAEVPTTETIQLGNGQSITRINEEQIDLFNPEELFNNESGNNNELTVSKELFNPKNPKVKTQLSDTEIKIISRLYSMHKKIYEPMGIYTLKEVLDEFILERISLDRQSRKEFVEAQKEAKKDGNNNIFSNMLGGLR